MSLINKEDTDMFKYKIDVLQTLKETGYNTNKLRKEKLLNESAIQYLRENKIIGIKPLECICALLDCQPGDILEYIPDELTNADTPK